MIGSSTGKRLALLVALVSIAAACGTRLNEEERALYTGSAGEAAAASGSSGGTSGSGTGSSGVTIPPTGGGVATGNGGGATAGGTSGAAADGPSTGPDGGGGAAATAEPCSAPSTEVGVTDDSLTLGGVFQLSGLLPGFAQTAAYGAQAYAEYLNASGGLCGRQVQYLVLDDGFDASRNAEQTGALLEQALSSVGGFSAADNGGAATLGQSNALEVGVGTTEDRQALPNHFPLLAPEERPPGGIALPEFRYAIEQGATRLAIVSVNAAAGRSTAEKNRIDAQAAGMDIVLELEVSATQFSYASTARAIADSGAQMVVCLLEINGSVQLAEELSRIPNSLQFAFYRLGYDQRFIDSAGAAAEGAASFLEFLPFEEAGTNAALDAFLQYYDLVAPGEPPTFQAIQGWVAMELYSQVLRSLPGPITRDDVLTAAQNLHEVDGQGLFANFDFASRQRPACKVVVRVVDGRYQREGPASGFYC